MRKALTISKYLTLNTLSILRAGKAKIALIFLGALIISLYLFVVSLTILNPYVWQNARKSVALPGLNKENVTETLAVFQTLTFIAIAMLPRRDITVSEQAEYEVLLTMPVTMQEYMLGRSLHLITQSVLVQSVFLVPGAFYAAAFSAGNTVKVLLFPLALVLWITFSEAFEGLISYVKVATQREKEIRLFALLYLLTAGAEYLFTRKTPILLKAPALLAVQPLVHCFTIKEPASLVLLETMLLGIFVLALMALQYLVSSYIYPEKVKPFSARTLTIRLGIRLLDLGFYSEKPEVSILKVSLLRPLLGIQGLILFAGLIVSYVAGIVVKRLFPMLDPYSLVTFAVIFILMVIIIELQLSIQEDLSPIWLYRVSMPNLKPLARVTVAKISLYTLVSFLAGGLFLFSVTGNSMSLFLPLFSLPSTVLNAVFTLGSVALVMTRRRIVRFSSRGFYLVEDMLALITLAISMSLSSLSVALFQMVSSYPSQLILLSAVSLPISLIIYFIGADIIGDMLTTRDVAS
ncbi:MAG: hypothetical protein JHC26_04795 [Thermofilum sp.]|uniref:hypothetical protein n=1 Tax=Thermofilum sp. TaxID=1961369 RepID=UPI002586966D|nr:hypothetical protein [Thermofilum sp.]MCI4408386.1 hypothetical protein [Thermofilum sp.]